MPASAIARSTIAREVRVLELAGGDVDRDRQAERAHRAGRGAEHELPSGPISPVSSASGMNSTGEAAAQRTSASTPTSSPLLRSICGW